MTVCLALFLYNSTFDLKRNHHCLWFVSYSCHMWYNRWQQTSEMRRTQFLKLVFAKRMLVSPIKGFFTIILFQPYTNIQKLVVNITFLSYYHLTPKKVALLLQLKHQKTTWVCLYILAEYDACFLIDAHSECRRIIWQTAKLPSDLMSCHWYTTNYMSTDPYNTRYVNLNAHLFTPD